MATSIIEFLSDAGLDNINFQLLATAITNVQSTKRDGTKVTFCTDAISPGDVLNNTGRVGMVIWLERAGFDAANAAIEARKTAGAPA